MRSEVSQPNEAGAVEATAWIPYTLFIYNLMVDALTARFLP